MAVQWFERQLESLDNLHKLGPMYYATLGRDSFKGWKDCLKELNLPDGTISLPQWPGIVKEENVNKTYLDAMHFLKTLKDIGASSPHESYTPLSISDMRKAMHLFNKNYNGHVNWHIVYGIMD